MTTRAPRISIAIAVTAIAAWAWWMFGPSLLIAARINHFVPITGTVTGSHIESTRGGYALEVRYAYTVSGRTYRGNRISASQTREVFRTRPQADAAAGSRYAPGAEISLFHDPAVPSLSARTRVPGLWAMGLALPTVMTAFACFSWGLLIAQRRRARPVGRARAPASSR